MGYKKDRIDTMACKRPNKPQNDHYCSTCNLPIDHQTKGYLIVGKPTMGVFPVKEVLICSCGAMKAVGSIRYERWL